MARFDPQTAPEFVKSLEYHRSRPETSFAQHLASLEEDLAHEALGKVRIYLDLRYWVFLRDASLGMPKKKVHLDLLDALVKGVDSDRLICPITDSVFFELDRQGDTERRKQSIRLIDRLSKGVVIKNAMDRLQSEVLDFLEWVTSRQQTPEASCRRVWVRPYSFLGTPCLKGGWEEAEQLAINKALLSYMWTRSIEDLLTDAPLPDGSSDQAFRDSAKRITESSMRLEPQMRSFPGVLAAEVGGFVDLHCDEIHRAFQHHLNLMFQEPAELGRDISSNIVYNIITKRRNGVDFPLVRIVAGLHVIIRWNRQRPFRFEDFFDIYHAAAAIPYCDAFFTEKYLATVCTRPPLGFSSAYSTQIVSDEEQALDVVLKLGA